MTHSHPIRSALFFCSMVCVLLWLLFSSGLLYSSSLLAFLHTDAAEWRSLYEHLAAHLNTGLLCSAIFLALFAVFYVPLKSILLRLLSIRSASFLLVLIALSASLRLYCPIP